jgi:nuclear protein localization family protein 4
MTVGEAGLTNGYMLYVMVDESKTGVHEMATMKKISKTGDIIAQEYEDLSSREGFRPGMMPLRDIKKQWTLGEFVAMDEQFEFRLKAPEKAHCTLVSTDGPSAEEFFAYARSFDFARMRVAYLYGTTNDAEKTVSVDCIYEPPQDTTDTSFTLLDDPNVDRVEFVAGQLGLKRVGWMFAHPPREEGFFFSTPEVLMAAEQQLEAAGGVAESLFVTVKVTIDQENKPLIDAWQISKQGLEMVAEGAIDVSTDLGRSQVNDTFTAYVEQKPTKVVDNNWFITRVGIGAYESKLISTFPKANREEIATQESLKAQISRAGKQGWSMKDLLGDFHLLLFLCDYMDMNNDIPRICKAVTDPDTPLDEGYQLIIRSLAGLMM